MTMTPRERVRLAIRHCQPDRVPYHFGCTTPARLKLEAYYGTTDLDQTLDNHLVKYKVRLPYEEVRPGFVLDEFGVVWNRTVDKDIGIPTVYQLSERSLAGYPFPDPRDPRRLAGLPAFVAAYPDRFRLASMGFSLFERAWTLRSMTELMVDMLEAPAWVDELLDAITDFNLATIDEILQYDVDGVLFGDDWGQQRGLLFSPALWRRFIKPRIARMYGRVKAGGRAVFIHTCGKVQELFPELIELGVDVFNPFQPDVMDVYAVKRQFGRQLSFYGGMSVQQLLPHGTPAQIRDEARRLLDEIGREGGYIIAPSHDMPGDIPVENMVAFIEAVRAG